MQNSAFTVADIFGDHMVLQRDKPVRIWGVCAQPQTLCALINGREVASTQAAAGAWALTLPPLAVQRDLTLEITGEKTGASYTFRDVAVGEVWIAGGQSNMEFPLAYDAEAKAAIAGANTPDIRFYDCPKIKFAGQEQEDDISRYGFWRPCDPANAPYYSAVGFYFAQKIHERYAVPVGIIGCNWGGTSASTWLDESYLAADEPLAVYLQEYAASLGQLDLAQYVALEKAEREGMKRPVVQRFMRYIMQHTPGPLLHPLCTAIVTASLKNAVPLGPRSENRPAGLYHTMVQKIAGYAVRGVIWYQGESDDPKPGLYARLFSALICCWRDAWSDDLPFLFVQLAPFERWLGLRAADFPLLREQQEAVAQTVTGAYMASIMDAGSRLDIHPKHKRPVGERLALLARGKVYGEDILCEAPEATGARPEDGRLVITFAHAGEGLTLKGRSLKDLVLMVDGKEVTPHAVSVGRDIVTVPLDGLRSAKELEVRCAYRNYAEVNLYNNAGLPAKPFRLMADNRV